MATIVKRVVVGTPIRSVNIPGTTLRGLFDVSVDSDLRDGDILTWVLSDAKWRNKPAEFFFDSDINALTVRIDANDSDIAELLAADSSFASQITIINTNVSNLTSDVTALYAFDSDQRVINQIREDFDSDLVDRLDSQRLDYIARDVVLQNQINNLENFVNASDSDFSDRLDSQRLDYIARDVVLRTSFENADSDINARIDSDYALLQSIRANLQNQIDSNETLFRNNDSDLGARIDSDYALLQLIRTNLRNVDSDINARIDSDYALLQSIRSNLQFQIDSNETFFRSVDANLQFQIDSNESYFRNIDSSLRSAIDSNYGVFLVARSLLQAQIDSNEGFFRAQDSSLGARIDSNYVAFITALNTLQGVDSGLQAQIDSNYAAYIVTKSVLEAADSNLQFQIDSNYSAFVATKASLEATDSNLQFQIDSNYSSFVSTKTALEAIDSSLQAQIDSNETFFRNVDSDISARIDSDYALLQSIRGNLQFQIDSNETFFRNADIALRSDIDSVNAELLVEKSQRISADSNIQAQIDSNYQQLISLTTSEVPEGSRLYYTDERVDDRVAQLLVPGTNIAIIYNDSNGTLSISSAGIDSAAINALIDSAVNPLQAQINSDGLDIQQLFSTTASLQTQINSDGTAIQILKNTAVSLQNQINSDGSDISALDVRVTALENSPGVDSAAVFSLIDQRIDSNDFVKLIGDQSINGIKTFNDSAFFGGGQVLVTPTAIRVGTGNFTQSAQWGTLALQGNRGGNIEFRDSIGTLVFDIYPYNDSGYTGINTYGARTMYLDAGLDLNLAATDDVLFRTAGTLRMTLDENGNLGIGGTPASVTGYTVLTLNNATNGGNIRFRNNGSTIGSISNTADRMILGTDAVGAFTAIQSGNVTRMNFAGNETRIAIGRSNTLADSNAIVDIVSTVRGILLPRMSTSQRDAISTPPQGLLVYDRNVNKFSRWDSSGWDYLTVDSDLHERGLTGGGNDKVFLVYSNRVTTSYTIDSNSNALTAGPITIDSGATVTIPVGSTWTIL